MADNNGLVPKNNNDGTQELTALKGNLEDASKSMVVFRLNFYSLQRCICSTFI